MRRLVGRVLAGDDRVAELVLRQALARPAAECVSRATGKTRPYCYTRRYQDATHLEHRQPVAPSCSTGGSGQFTPRRNGIEATFLHNIMNFMS